MALWILNEGKAVADLNQNFIVLISKIKNACKMTDFRPISLCNVPYKNYCKGALK